MFSAPRINRWMWGVLSAALESALERPPTQNKRTQKITALIRLFFYMVISFEIWLNRVEENSNILQSRPMNERNFVFSMSYHVYWFGFIILTYSLLILVNFAGFVFDVFWLISLFLVSRKVTTLLFRIWFVKNFEIYIYTNRIV